MAATGFRGSKPAAWLWRRRLGLIAGRRRGWDCRAAALRRKRPRAARSRRRRPFYRGARGAGHARGGGHGRLPSRASPGPRWALAGRARVDGGLGRAFGLGPGRIGFRFFSNLFLMRKQIPEKSRNCLKARKILRKSQKFQEHS
jgi:hypothetical protein